MTKKFYVLEPLEPAPATEHFASFDLRTNTGESGQRSTTVYRYKKPASEHNTAIYFENDARGDVVARTLYWTSVTDTRPQEQNTRTFTIVDANNPLIMLRHKGNRACEPITDAAIKATKPGMDDAELEARKAAVVQCLRDLPEELQPSSIEGMVRRTERSGAGAAR